VIQISSRYLGILLALLIIVLAPVSIYSYRGHPVDDCARPDALRDVMRIPGTLDAREQWRVYGPRVAQSTAGRIASEQGLPPMDFRVMRTFEPVRAYLRPYGFLSPAVEPDQSLFRSVEVDGEELQIPVVHGNRGSHVHFATYLLIYAHRIDNKPFRTQLETALAQLVRGTRPITLFLVSGIVPQTRLRVAEREAFDWLANAWRHYGSVCLE
jgi:hypothetical protein